MTQPEFHLEFPDGTLAAAETFESLAQARLAALMAAIEERTSVIIRKTFDFFPVVLTEETIFPSL